MLKNILFVATFFTLSNLEVIAQRNFHISQYMLHQPLFNPASISSYDGVKGALIHRNQWVGFDGAPTVTGLNFTMPIMSTNHHVGATILHDAIGVNSDINIAGQYAYKFRVDKESYLSLGLSAMLRMIRSDFAKVSVNDLGDDIFSGASPTFMTPNFSIGAYYFRDRFYAGFSMPTMLANTITFDQNYGIKTSFKFSELHYNLHAGYGYPINKDLNLNFSTLIKAVSGAPLQADLNIQAVFNKRLGVGLSYRTSKDIVGLLSIQIIKQLRLAYAYDYNMSQIAQFSSGSHEIMLLFDFYEPKIKAGVDIPRF